MATKLINFRTIAIKAAITENFKSKRTFISHWAQLVIYCRKNIMKFSSSFLSCLLFLSCHILINAQVAFEEVLILPNTEIKSQQSTQTCWSFATTSFLESQLLQSKQEEIDLSEMFIVRNVYKNKAMNYVLRQGGATFSSGALAHDYINAIKQYGLVPESVYTGRVNNERYSDRELLQELKEFLDGVIKSMHPSQPWMPAFEEILETYMGSVPENFKINGMSFDAKSYADYLGFTDEVFMSFTSFTHHPYHRTFILEIPDNFSNGSYYNVPMQALSSIVDHALQQGATIIWDGDVSEKGFAAKSGFAVLPKDTTGAVEDFIDRAEIKPSQAERQAQFMSYLTTDDHLMHIVGKVTSGDGRNFYKIKNSWGPIGPYNGYLYMSETYFLMKTVGLTLELKNISHELRQQLQIN